MTSILPYWDQNIELDIVPWIPYGKDFSPVTVNTLYSPLLGDLAGLALEMQSEFLYLRSFQSGNIGTMARQNMIDPARNRGIEFGFTMIFTFSEQVEKSMISLIKEFNTLKAGLTLCGIWSGDVLVDECKVLMVVSEDMFFDEVRFLESLRTSFRHLSGRVSSNMSFFAEKFGYRRFSISYETDNLTSMRITQALFDMELDATKELLGPAPEMKLPILPGLGLL
jgi:hypothetical protein